MSSLRVEGLKELDKKLRDNVTMDDVKKVVHHNGGQLTEKMVENADFKKGYQTGTTKRSIGIELTDGGLTAEVAPKTEYSPYVEYGTRFMSAQPFVRPAFESQKGKFLQDLKKLTK